MFPILLNDRWQIVDDPLQWILQRRKEPGKAWAPVAYCRTRAGLQLRIRGDLDPPDRDAALAMVVGFPEFHD